MPAPRIRGDYDQLQNIAKMFARNAQQLQKTSKKLQRNINELQSGGWVGQGANKFYQEMSNDVMPSMNRLARSMNSASRVTIKILKLFKEVESIWMRIFKALGLGGALGAGAGAGAGAGNGAGGGAAGAGVPAWQQDSPFLVRDPEGLFTDDYMKDLIGYAPPGAGSDELGDIMNELLDNPSEARTDELLDQLADLRGRPRIEIQVEWDKFKEIQEQQAEVDPEGPDSLVGGSMNPHMGSITQMRYGKVVGDAFGIDPTFGAMLNPTGGLVGYGRWAVPGGDTAVGYHGIVHDAAGYLYNNHNAGPGYDYLRAGNRGQPGSPFSGQAVGIRHWRGLVGSDSASEGAEYIMDRGVRGLDRASSFVDEVGSYF